MRKVDILHEKPDGERLFHDRVPREKERKAGSKRFISTQDSRSFNLVILEALEKYGVKTVDILSSKKECRGKTLTEENH